LTYEREWKAMVEGWQRGLAWAVGEIATIQQESRQLFPEWLDLTWNDWQPPRDLPPAVRLGDYQVSMEPVLDGLAHERRTRRSGLQDFWLPALCAFPGRCSLLLHAEDAGRDAAVRAMQGVMFRMLTSIPPGKVRFTIIDPVGLGQNFAAFMHLADHDEALVGSRIWTEMAHIEQRLADVTAHMENVIQKYLRNQFETIEDYNVQAGEVAEPFRVLVVANFPANFSVDAARRL